jgi:hypothetical protein
MTSLRPPARQEDEQLSQIIIQYRFTTIVFIRMMIIRWIWCRSWTRPQKDLPVVEFPNFGFDLASLRVKHEEEEEDRFIRQDHNIII